MLEFSRCSTIIELTHANRQRMCYMIYNRVTHCIVPSPSIWRGHFAEIFKVHKIFGDSAQINPTESDELRATTHSICTLNNYPHVATRTVAANSSANSGTTRVEKEKGQLRSNGFAGVYPSSAKTFPRRDGAALTKKFTPETESNSKPSAGPLTMQLLLFREITGQG